MKYRGIALIVGLSLIPAFAFSCSGDESRGPSRGDGAGASGAVGAGAGGGQSAGNGGLAAGASSGNGGSGAAGPSSGGAAAGAGGAVTGGMSAGGSVGTAGAGAGGTGGSLSTGGSGGSGGAATIVLDANTTYQTITGWEATAQAGHDPIDSGGANFDAFKNDVFDRAVEMGINRLRVEVKSGAENATDHWSELQAGTIDLTQWKTVRYPPVNDDADPMTLNASGFKFSELDSKMNKVVLPMKQRLEANGENLFINVCYVSFLGSTTSFHASDEDEYAEFVLATVQHLDTTFGIVPDSWEIILEPDNVDVWTGPRIGASIVASASRLAANGYESVKFIAPSNTNMTNAVTYFDSLIQVSGVEAALAELAYHRYGGVSTASLQAIAARAATYGIGTSMLEHIDSGIDDLHDDLTVGMNTAWQQFTIAYPGSTDVGSKYFGIQDPNTASPTVVMMSRARLLRQYFKFIRAGAVRFGATTADNTFLPVAFTNTSGSVVVVVKASSGGSFSIDGLPPGTYGIKYTTGTAYDMDHSDQTLAAGGRLTTSIPAAGAITIFGR